MRQEEWAKALVGVIAQAVKHYREQREPRLSAQKIADRCAQLGFPSITRSVITNLENGVRESLSVPEWLVLADALRVPPLLLLSPVGRTEEQIELLPDIELTPWDAVTYLENGSRPLMDHEQGESGKSSTRSDFTLLIFREHSMAVERWHRLGNFIRAAEEPLTEEPADDLDEVLRKKEEFERERDKLPEEIRKWRLYIRAMKLVPPKLPPALRYLDSEPSVSLSATSRAVSNEEMMELATGLVELGMQAMTHYAEQRKGAS